MASTSQRFNTFATLVRGMAVMNTKALAGLFDRPNRVRFLEACRPLGVYMEEPAVDRVDGSIFVDDTHPITLTRFNRSAWQVTTLELATLMGLLKTIKPKRIFEFGTFDGRTTLNLHLNAPDTTIHTLNLAPGDHDLPDEKRPGEMIKDLVAAGKIHQLFGDSMTYDFSEFHGKEDFIFIDAGHAYPNAMSDTRNALRMAEGLDATIVWHDYGSEPGVTRTVNEIQSYIRSRVQFGWIKGTSLAVMRCNTDSPLAFDLP